MITVDASASNWMQLHSGKAFYPLDPRVEDVEINDIAHALGMLCRYGGHVDRFYSVAEHCVLMSQAVSSENALFALLHDATEAYLCDLVRPVKRQIPQYEEIEDNLAGFVFYRFGLDPTFPVEIHEADSRILHDERVVLLKPSPKPWAAYIEALEPLGVEIQCWSPDEAKRRYLERFEELTA